MNNNVEILNHPMFGNIRTIIDPTSHEALFCAYDACITLGYVKPRNAIARHVDKSDVVKRGVGVVTGTKADGTPAVQTVQMSFINESGLYALIMGSKLPEARRFQHWVTHDVLPSIRKYGYYCTKSLSERIIENPQILVDIAQQMMRERDGRDEGNNEIVSR